MRGVAEFWDGLSLENRRELIEEALEPKHVARSLIQALAGNQWHCIPERLIIDGVYIKDELLPLLQDSP